MVEKTDGRFYYLMSAVLYVLIVLASVSQSWSGKAYNKKGGASYLFNALKAGSALIMFGIMSAYGFTFRWETLVFGAFYGVSLSLSMYSGYRALVLGPMSLTSMLVSLSVIVPVVWGVSVRGEELNAFKYAAFLFLVLALFLTNADKLKKGREKENTNYPKWLFCIAVTFIANGVCSVLQKEYQVALPGGENDEFMFFAMLVSSLIYIPVCIFKSREEKARIGKSAWLGVFSGCMMGLASFFTLILAGFSSASVMFPIISASTILGALLCGHTVFREKLKVNHYIAMLLGVLTVVFMKI